MKILIAAVILFSSLGLFGQNGKEYSVYFPKERLVHPNCQDKQNGGSCLNAILENRILSILNKYERRYESIKDTLELSLSLFVDESGQAIKKNHYEIVSAPSIKNKTREKLVDIIDELPKLSVQNPKPEFYDVRHTFEFKFLIQSTNDQRFKALHQYDYSGGDIMEIPVFPGCEGLGSQLAKDCFNEKMQEHIAMHFVYPQQALDQRISGVVKMMMTINEQGYIENIKTKGPHPLLVNEAVRIVNLLPRLTPGRVNGKQADFPYSIPVTFRLN